MVAASPVFSFAVEYDVYNTTALFRPTPSDPTQNKRSLLILSSFTLVLSVASDCWHVIRFAIHPQQPHARGRRKEETVIILFEISLSVAKSYFLCSQYVL